MRTNIDIDDELLARATQATGATTKKAVVEAGLQMLVKLRAQENIRELRGKVQFYDDVMEESRLADIRD